VKAELKITEAQTPAWNEVAEAVRNTAKHRNERMQALFSGSTKTDSLPERLDVHEKLLSVILDDVKQIKGGVSKLYAVLSDEQKEEADDIVLPMVGIGMGRWGWHHWRD
ncbi:MAG: Spy/CpxP family protein refolding chaperone, partial [Hyphomicrobiaceae bacterium]